MQLEPENIALTSWKTSNKRRLIEFGVDEWNIEIPRKEERRKEIRVCFIVEICCTTHVEYMLSKRSSSSQHVSGAVSDNILGATTSLMNTVCHAYP